MFWFLVTVTAAKFSGCQPAFTGEQRPSRAPAQNWAQSSGTLIGKSRKCVFGDSGASTSVMCFANHQPDKGPHKPSETALSHQLQLSDPKASIGNLTVQDQPLIPTIFIHRRSYAKPAGNLLIVAPRVLGNKSSDLLERKEDPASIP